MTSVTTQIEIASSPEHVREVFLDFAKMPQWSQSFFKSIVPAADKPTVEPGDKLNVALPGMVFSPTVVDNSPQAFVWRGSLWGLFAGEHYFRFEPSKITPGSTTFRQGEDFSGLLLFLLKSYTKTAPGFETFNEDLKRKVESDK